MFEKRRKTVTINNLQKEINQIITDKQNIIEFNKSLVNNTNNNNNNNIIIIIINNIY